MSKIDKEQVSEHQESHGKSDPASTGAPRAGGGKLFPPASDVDVPRMPAKAKDTDDAKTGTDNVDPVGQTADQIAPNAPPVAKAGDKSPPAKIDTTEANWADSTQPAPDKRTARSSIL